MHMTFPMILTLLRIALIPVLVLFFYLPFEWANLAAAAIFILAAITDWLDGYLARRLNLQSKFGAFLDPVADKLMVTTALILILHQHPTIWNALIAAIIIGRELTISALREWMSELGERNVVAVSKFGKWKTIAQMVGLGMMIWEYPFYGLPIFHIGFALLVVAAGLTLWSMFVYIQAAWPSLLEES